MGTRRLAPPDREITERFLLFTPWSFRFTALYTLTIQLIVTLGSFAILRQSRLAEIVTSFGYLSCLYSGHVIMPRGNQIRILSRPPRMLALHVAARLDPWCHAEGT